jgi:hypothetical protein
VLPSHLTATLESARNGRAGANGKADAGKKTAAAH